MLVENIDDPNISEFLSLKEKALPPNLMIAESAKVVLKAIQTNQKFIKIFCTKDFENEHKSVLQPLNHRIYTADKKIMEGIVGHKLHHGVMALIERPCNITINDLDNKVIVLNGLTSPENVGTIIRTAASFNIRSIIVDSKTCSPYLRRCIRVSMGNIFFVKVYFSNNLKNTINELKERSYSIYSAANTVKSISLQKFNFSKKSVVLIGSEGHGIDKVHLEQSDSLIKIDIKNDVAHINAASAASIFLYQWSLSEKV